MNDTIHTLVDHHIKEYDLRLRHLDDILWQAQKRLLDSDIAETSAELAKLKQERDRLASWFRAIKQKPAQALNDDEILKAGPMDVWDAVARHGELLMRSMERRSRRRVKSS